MHFAFYCKVMGSHWRADSNFMLMHKAIDWLGISSFRERKGEGEDIKDELHVLHNLCNGEYWLENEERI